MGHGRSFFQTGRDGGPHSEEIGKRTNDTRPADPEADGTATCWETLAGRPCRRVGLTPSIPFRSRCFTKTGGPSVELFQVMLPVPNALRVNDACERKPFLRFRSSLGSVPREEDVVAWPDSRKRPPGWCARFGLEYAFSPTTFQLRIREAVQPQPAPSRPNVPPILRGPSPSRAHGVHLRSGERINPRRPSVPPVRAST